MDKNFLAELTVHDCQCRECDDLFVGHGALCPICATANAEQAARQNEASAAITAERALQQRRERKARSRREWVEIV